IQTNQQVDLDKSSDVGPFLHPIAGGNSIFSANGDEWRHVRDLLASGFNSAYILSQTEHVVELAEVYVRVLEEYAKKGDIFLLEKINLNYTMDISGVLTL